MDGLGRMRLAKVGFGLLLVWVSSTVASAVAGEDGASAKGRSLYLGRCVLDENDEEKLAESWVKVCFKGAAGAEILSNLGHGEEGVRLRYAEGYLALHAGSWFSLHGRGEARQVEVVERLKRQADQPPPRVRRDVYTDYALVRLGNPVVHRYRLQAGRMRLPFGLDLSTAPEVVRAQETRLFWASPPNGVSFIADNLATTSIEIGYGNDAFTRKQDKRRSQLGQQAVSFRWAYDMSALDGSRIILSGYQEEGGRVRAGAAFYTENLRGDLWHLELVRILTTEVGERADFLQLIRLGYRGAFEGPSRWSFQLDDERRLMRQGVLTYEAALLDHLKASLALGYRRDESGPFEHRWLLVAGMEAHL